MAATVLSFALACVVSKASAQSFDAAFPRLESPNSWTRPNTQCNGTDPSPFTVRSFNSLVFTTTTPGDYTISVTRRGGGFVALSLFQPTFDPLAACSGVAAPDSPTGDGSVTKTFTVGAPGNLQLEAVVSGASATDGGSFTLTVTGPAPVVASCPGNGTLVPTQQDVAGSGGSSSLYYAPRSGAGCDQTWSTSGVAGFITGIPASGTGPTTITYSVAANGGTSRSDTFSIGNRSFTVNQAAAGGGCTYGVAPTSTTAPATGRTSTFTLSATPGCAWTAASLVPWITGVTPSGSGNGTVAYTVGANSGPIRTGAVLAGGQAFTVVQASGCSATLATSSASVDENAHSLSVDVTMSDAACPWSATTSDAWITVSTPSGTGSGTISFEVAANTGPSRLGTIQIGGRSFTVSQRDGCPLSVSPVGSSVGSAGGTLTFDVQTGPGCPFYVGGTSPYLHAQPATGIGPTRMTVDVDASDGSARSGSVILATYGGRTAEFGVQQGDGCVLSLPSTSGDAPASNEGPSPTFPVLHGPGCTFTTSTSESWLRAEASLDGTYVSYWAEPYDGGGRTATITLTSTGGTSSATFTVTQRPGCTLTLPYPFGGAGAEGGKVYFSVWTAWNCEFTVTSNDPFLRVEAIDGPTVTVSVERNTGRPRTGTLTIVAPSAGARSSFVITQEESGVASTTDGGVVSIVPIGSGCSAVPHGDSNARAVFLLLAVCFLHRLRRRRSLGAIVVAATTLVPAVGAAQGYDLERFRSSTSIRHDYTTVESGEARIPGPFEVGTTLGYDVLPLVGDSQTGGTVRIVGGQLVFAVRGAVAFGDRLRIAAQMPFVLGRTANPDVLGPAFSEIDHGAVGDLAIVPKVSLLTRTPTEGRDFGNGFAVAFVLPMTLPTGNDSRLAGEPFTIEPRVATDYATSSGFGAALSVGYRFRHAQNVLGTTIDDELTIGLAGRAPLVGEKVMAIAEVVTDVSVLSNDVRSASRGEVLGSIRIANEAIVANLGMGAGILGGVDTPRFRLFASLSYAPTRRTATPPVAPPPPEQVEEPTSEPAPGAPAALAEAAPEVAAQEPSARSQDVGEPPVVLSDAGPVDPCAADPDAPACRVPEGCPSPSDRRRSDEAGLTTTIRFASAAAALRPEDEAAIRALAEHLLSHPELGRVVIVGHADRTGGDAGNRRLSAARARAVRSALMRAGVPASRLEVRGLGSRCATDALAPESERSVEILLP